MGRKKLKIISFYPRNYKLKIVAPTGSSLLFSCRWASTENSVRFFSQAKPFPQAHRSSHLLPGFPFVGVLSKYCVSNSSISFILLKLLPDLQTRTSNHSYHRINYSQCARPNPAINVVRTMQTNPTCCDMLHRS